MYQRAILSGICLASALGTQSLAQPSGEWTMYAPTNGGSTDTHLIDLEGYNVHTWSSTFPPALAAYLIDDGTIIRPANDPSVQPFGSSGVGGRIERIAWDGTVEWSYVIAGADHVQHHDIEVMPNGNILAIVWERHTRDELIALGRDPNRAPDEIWTEAVYEIAPSGTDGGEIVWVWRAFDNLIQDFDPNLPNYGVIADHPGRININGGSTETDWLHFNGIDYNEELDQIVVSTPTWNEIWIISHASGDSGELLYRWGNPQMYGRGDSADRKLYGQHHPEWIREGPGAGNISVFSNGAQRGYSTVEEIDTGVLPDGTYEIPTDAPFGPEDFVSTVDNIDGDTFFGSFMSGAQRLPNGNTLICITPGSLFAEVTPEGTSVWTFPGTFAFRAERFDARDPRLEGHLWCAADFNGDDATDTQDVLDFLNAWSGGQNDADFNNDGAIDTRDAIAFLDRWVTGC